ncbi:cytochrome P450 [Streptomyces sp. NPDC001985]|uniref:cytochrome P450 n=1 Tax=Streptomyces sp. NPDC001985 TaxID=3154406 RepID=UPI003317B69A
MTPSYTLATAPGALPLLGHTLALARRPLEFTAGLGDHGDLVRIVLGPRPTYVACHPDLVRSLLVGDRAFDKGGPVFDKLRETAGDGLITCPATEHRRQRRLTQPAFHRDRIAGYAPLMAEEIDRLTGGWRHGRTLDVTETMYRLTTAVAVRCLFGAGTDTAGLSALRESLDAVTRSINQRVLLPLPAVERLPTPNNRRFARARAHLRALTDDLIADHRSTPGGGPPDLMSTLLAARDEDGTGVTDQEIHDQTVTFLLASVETTAGVLSWVFHLLGTRPGLRDRLRAEAESVLGGRPAGHDDLPALELTGRVLTETLRLYPPAWLLTRTAPAATRLGGHPIPAGATLMYSPYQLHRRADHYPDPGRFDPDRWLSSARPAPGAWVPFGGGARKCIGDTFALTEATLALATIAARWQFHPVPGSRLRPLRSATLIPQGLTMRLSDRRRAGG